MQSNGPLGSGRGRGCSSAQEGRGRLPSRHQWPSCLFLLGKQAGGLTPNTSLHIGPDREPLLCSAVHEEGPGQGIPEVGQGEGTLEPCARQPAAPDVSPSVSHRPGYQGSVLLWHTQVINTA